MAAKTTQVELKGDRVQARSLAEAHVPRLMFDFRRNQSFQDLAIYSETKKFYDQTGAYVGTVYMQSVNGAENIVVTCDAGKPEIPKEKHAEQITPLPLSRLVPCMRSGDNQYWVACMSGTFEGPYKLFKNVTGVTAADMDDNVEVNIDGQFMSTDGEYYLFFVAQTGVRPGGTDIDLTGNLSETHDFTSSAGTIHVVICWGGCMGRNAWTSEADRTVTENRSIMVYGTDIGLPRNGFIAVDESDRYGGNCWVSYGYGCSGELTVVEQDVIDACGNVGNPGPTPGEDTFSIPGGEYYNQWNTTYTAEGCSLWSGEYSVRIETNNHQNHAACYRTSSVETHTHRIRDYQICDLEGALLEETVTATTSKCDYLKVNSTVYPLREVSSDTYPQFDNIGLKYYNTDSIAQITALLGAYIYGQDQFGYYYVGPNSNNSLVSTNFPRLLTGQSRHTIPDMKDADGNLVEFYGEIFLGRVDYAIEEKVQLY